MHREQYYYTGDYVIYKGAYTNLEDYYRNKDYAQIVEFSENKQWVGLRLLTSEKTISTHFSNIRPISTEKEHLANIGFSEVLREDRVVKYTLNSIVITSIGFIILLENGRTMFPTGFCIYDFENYPTDKISEYLNKENELDMKKFQDEHNSIWNINMLFDELEKMEIVINKDEVIKSIWLHPHS